MGAFSLIVVINLLNRSDFKMPNFLKPFKNKGSANSAGDGQILTNRPFYLSPEHLSQHTNALEANNCGPRAQNNQAQIQNDLPMLDQYSDPKDLIDTFKNSVQVDTLTNEEEQNYMVPFSESQQHESQQSNTQSTTTVLHTNKQRDSLSERLETGFNGEVYENIPTESPEHRQVESTEVSPSHLEGSFYETTWGTFNNNNNNPVLPSGNLPGNVFGRNEQPSDCYQNYNSQLQVQGQNDQMMYENAMVHGRFGGSPDISNESRYANDNVFDDTLTGVSQIPMHDSRPDAEYDVPWTSAHGPPPGSNTPTPPLKPKTESEVSRRQVLKSSNSTDEFTPQPAARRRHKSGDPGKNLLSKNTPSATSGYQQQKQQPAAPQLDIHQTKTMDFRPEDDYDQPWNLTSKPPSKPVPATNLDASQSIEASFNASHQKQQSSNVASSGTVTAVTGNEDRNITSQHSSSHALHKSHHRSSHKVKKQASSSQQTTGELVDPNVALEEQSWYHGQISRVAAEARLRPAPECSYLVRRSESSRHDYSLSIKSASNIMHMKIQYQESSRKYILGQFSKPYSSIPAMIAYYSKHTLNIKGAENVILLRPVPDTADNML